MPTLCAEYYRREWAAMRFAWRVWRLLGLSGDKARAEMRRLARVYYEYKLAEAGWRKLRDAELLDGG